MATATRPSRKKQPPKAHCHDPYIPTREDWIEFEIQRRIDGEVTRDNLARLFRVSGKMINHIERRARAKIRQAVLLDPELAALASDTCDHGGLD